MVQAIERQETDYRQQAVKIAQALKDNAIERDRLGGLPHQEVELLKQSDLLLLPIPQQHGGSGKSWSEIFQVVRTLAAADGSTGQLYTNHAVLVALAAAAGRTEQAEHYFNITAKENLFWANAVNGRDGRLHITPDEDAYLVNGIKSFGTGVAVADMNVFAAVQPGVEEPITFILPQDRAGISYNYDWDNIGQRRTASGSYTFEQVKVNPREILGPPSVSSSAFSTLIFLVAQLAKTYVYLGIAEGALAATKEYTQTKTRPWISSGVDRATEDPYILHHYGKFWTELQAAIALASTAANQIDAGWQQGFSLSFATRGEIAIAVSAAKAFATKVGLNLTSQMFQVMGSRATSCRYRYDRYWRDLRTFTLHDPVDYKLRDVGNWLLNDVVPTPSQYS